MKINTLQEFYTLLNQCRDAKRKLTVKALDSAINPEDTAVLHQTLDSLEQIPQNKNGYQLFLDEYHPMTIDLTYEINELNKDIIFLEQGEEQFLEHLSQIHPTFNEELDNGLSVLQNIDIQNFFTDRDGTVNNYCGRYLSSIQSVYNAVFLTRFIKKRTKTSILLTSAPLDNTGIVEMSLFPSHTVIYAGSKGREFIGLNGKRHHYSIEPDQQDKLNELNSRLSLLVNKIEYQKFSLIGSGLQFKFGQTTIARQDITFSVPEEESLNFLQYIDRLVKEIDPKGSYFRIEDTGLDIEVILTVGNDTGFLKDFDKGDGIQFIAKYLDIDLANTPILVAGDTNSDVPMAEACLEISDQTTPIFVTKDTKLAYKVKALSPQTLIFSEPDILVSLLNQLAKEK